MDEIGYTWGEWREMSEEERERELQDIVNELVEVYIVDDER
jgi:ribosomal protein L29